MPRRAVLAIHLAWLDHSSPLCHSERIEAKAPLDLLILYQAVAATFQDEFSPPAPEELPPGGRILNRQQAAERLSSLADEETRLLASAFARHVIALSSAAASEQDLRLPCRTVFGMHSGQERDRQHPEWRYQQELRSALGPGSLVKALDIPSGGKSWTIGQSPLQLFRPRRTMERSEPAFSTCQESSARLSDFRRSPDRPAGLLTTTEARNLRCGHSV